MSTTSNSGISIACLEDSIISFHIKSSKLCVGIENSEVESLIAMFHWFYAVGIFDIFYEISSKLLFNVDHILE